MDGTGNPDDAFSQAGRRNPKKITATLLQGRTLVCFDNVEGVLSSPALALVLTAHVDESRILGVSQNMVALNRAT